jgi:protein tyrosine phosphatase (PTP) superfamily phosphohydrolase (DUF442 family)
MRKFIATVYACTCAALLSAAAPQVEPVTLDGVTAANVVVVSPKLVTAGQPNKESLQNLKKHGYDAVIYLAPGDSKEAIPEEAAILKGQGIEYVHVPIPWNAPEAAHLQATAEAMKSFQGKKVLVHCQLNMRASAITFLYRVIHAKEDPTLAWADVRKVWTPRDQWATYLEQQLAANGVGFKPF